MKKLIICVLTITTSVIAMDNLNFDTLSKDPNWIENMQRSFALAQAQQLLNANNQNALQPQAQQQIQQGVTPPEQDSDIVASNVQTVNSEDISDTKLIDEDDDDSEVEEKSSSSNARKKTIKKPKTNNRFEPAKNGSVECDDSDCDKTFCNKSSMVRHYKRFHTDQKKEKAAKEFECPECDRSYSSNSNRAKHYTQKHRGETKPSYKCKKCKKTFWEKAEFVNHNRIHTGEKPHKCDQCEVSFAQISNLYAHQRTVHK